MKNTLLPAADAAKRPNAFTLLEMMVVLLIIALIIGSVAVMMNGIEGNAQGVTTSAKINGIQSSLTSYKLAALTYPTQQQGLEALVTRPTSQPLPKRWTQTAKAEALIDPWGRKLVYRNPGKHNTSSYDVFSLGPDGIENTEDDIGNW